MITDEEKADTAACYKGSLEQLESAASGGSPEHLGMPGTQIQSGGVRAESGEVGRGQTMDTEEP